MTSNLYDLLEVGLKATEAEIASAYRKVARKWHPDRNPDNPDAATMFHKIFAAYETLMDPAKRSVYDKEVRDTLFKAQRTKEAKETLEKQAAEARRRNDIMSAAVHEMKLRLFQKEEEHKRREDETSGVRKREALKEAELRRMREENEDLMVQHAERESRRLAAMKEQARAELADGSVETTIRVKWDSDLFPLTSEYLRSVFERAGPLVTILMRKPGVALVVFQTMSGLYGCKAAAASVERIVSLKISFMDKKSKLDVERMDRMNRQQSDDAMEQ